MNRTALLSSLFGCLVLASGPAASTAQAAEYPDKPVTILVAFAPGGATDVLARKLGQELGEHYKQTFVIDNKPGAGGNIGTAAAARSRPDGYTLYLGTVASHGVAPNLYRELPYDPVKDFTPIGMISSSPQIVVVHPESQFKTVDDLANYAKSAGEKMMYASSGIGTTIHLSGETFNIMAGTKMTHVPFQGSGPAVTALLGRHVDVLFDDLPSSAPHVKEGALRALAVTGKSPSPLFPELPTLSEAGKAHGLEGFDVSAWFFLAGPANLPEDVADSLNTALNEILDKPSMKEFLAARGAEPMPGTREDATTFIAAELKKWGNVIREGNIPLQ